MRPPSDPEAKTLSIERFPVDLRKRIRMAALRNEMTAREAYIAAAEAWLAEVQRKLDELDRKEARASDHADL